MNFPLEIAGLIREGAANLGSLFAVAMILERYSREFLFTR